MSALKLIGRLLWKLWVLVRSAPPSASPTPVVMPPSSPIFNQEHVWESQQPDQLSKEYWRCSWCKQPMGSASRYCPGPEGD